MADEKRSPLSQIPQILMGAAATLARPWSFFRASKAPANGVAPSAMRSKLDIRKWTPELLKQLEWRRFEELCVAYFEAIGSHTRVSAPGPDGAVDIYVEEGSPDAATLVQCKAWDAYRVGIKAVRELRGAMTAAKVGKGVMITSGRFTQEAFTYAAKENIQLIDGAAFFDRLTALAPDKSLALLKFATHGDFLTPTCPACSIKMTSRQSTKEGRKFWGCRNYPRCKQTIAPTSYAPA
jgi:restriction system protein